VTLLCRYFMKFRLLGGIFLFKNIRKIGNYGAGTILPYPAHNISHGTPLTSISN
jgi:hypothetical protein